MNETILVTGASGKIGSQIVAGFLQKGHDVIAVCSQLASKKSMKERFSNNPNLSVIALDLMGEQAIDCLIQELSRLEKSSYILINNARDLKNMSIENHEKIPRGKFMAEFLLGVVIPYELTMALVACESTSLKVVLNISSIYGVVTPNLMIYERASDVVPAHYGVTKSALNHLTKELAVRLAAYQIRVNGLAFGGVEGRVNSEFKSRYEKLCPSQKMLSEADLFGPVSLLTSEACSAITGEIVVADGGWTLW